MPVQLTIKGIDDLKRALADLPPQLKGDATVIVLDSAHSAAADIRSQYPKGLTGNLQKGVKVRVQEVGPLSVAAQVRNTAPHAHLWEFGTEARHTKLGWNRGVMKRPPAPVFIPTMIRYRNVMYEKLAAIIEAKGLTVKRGSAA
jgi:hypothetical protein